MSSLKKVQLRGNPYFVELETGHAYHRLANGSQGEWAGMFRKSGHPENRGPWIDDSVAAPERNNSKNGEGNGNGVAAMPAPVSMSAAASVGASTNFDFESLNPVQKEACACLARLMSRTSTPISTVETTVLPKKERKNPWAGLSAEEKQSKIAAMKSARSAKTSSAIASMREPSQWILFTKRVRDLLKANGYNGKAIGVEANQFASSLKAEEPDLSAWSDQEILARRKAWTAPRLGGKRTLRKVHKSKQTRKH